MNHDIRTRRLHAAAELDAAFAVMRELRPHLADPAAFARQVARQREHGYLLLAAFDGERIVGLAGYRLTENLLYGRFAYVDDLVVTAPRQRQRIGERLLDAVRHHAAAAECRHLVLDTGLHMAHAQRFYFRAGLLARGMHFVDALEAGEAEAA